MKSILHKAALLTYVCILFAPFSILYGAGDKLTTLTDKPENCADECLQVSIKDLFSQKAYRQIDSFYKMRVKNDHFNGCVLIAKDGVPIYSAAYGYGNLTIKDTLSTYSSIQLASVSKTFTSTAILLLAEQGFLSLDDSIQKFFPEFPYPGITVKLLLSHRTGLPDYTYFPKEGYGKNIQYINNQQVINYFTERKPALRCKPDHMFIYCNTNYALLASIIEHVTGTTYAKFMHDIVFAPLGMTNSYVYNAFDSLSGPCCTISYDSKGNIWKNCPSDGVVGDKGIYSSVDDMLKWDNALRNGLLLSEATLNEAYKPRSLDRYSFVKAKDKNYGYGWRITKQADNTSIIYHNGFWHGSNNVFARDLTNGFTIIVLGNKSNNANYWTGPVWNALGLIKNLENVADLQ